MAEASGRLREAVGAGLTRTFTELKPGQGVLEAGLTATRLTGAQAWVEARYLATPQLGLFARGFAGTADSGVLAGAQLRF